MPGLVPGIHVVLANNAKRYDAFASCSMRQCPGVGTRHKAGHDAVGRLRCNGQDHSFFDYQKSLTLSG